MCHNGKKLAPLVVGAGAGPRSRRASSLTCPRAAQIADCSAQRAASDSEANGLHLVTENLGL